MDIIYAMQHVFSNQNIGLQKKNMKPLLAYTFGKANVCMWKSFRD